MSPLKKMFSEDNLRDYYFTNVKYSSSPGIDKINNRLFENSLPTNVETITRKVLDSTYKFTSYKEKLIFKGRNKIPRLISIPTIRDKITLGILKNIINSRFSQDLNRELVKVTISDIKTVIKSNEYDYYIKLDIENFYGSLNHDLLLKRVRRKIRKKEILNLIESAIKTPTVNLHEQNNNKKSNKIGVPQGLPISNVLASIYLNNFDINFKESITYRYYRYVDDILILCKKADAQIIKNNLIEKIKTYKLSFNQDKTAIGDIVDGFSFLGYKMYTNKFTVRESSLRKLEYNIEKLFADYRNSDYKNIDFFVWKLNLKITGCINENKKYGWMFFFSQIDDLALLFHIDWLVEKLIVRYDLKKKLKIYMIKKFSKSLKEITLNLHNTKYIPNFDNYSETEKLDFLKNVCGEQISNIDINSRFKKIIFTSIKDLEKDIQSFS